MQIKNLQKMHTFQNCNYRFEDAPKELEPRQIICQQTSVTELVPEKYTLNGRQQKMVVSEKHFVHKDHSMHSPWPPLFKVAIFGMGNFWYTEKIFLQCPGIYSTQTGYIGGHTPNPTYKEVRTGMTNHAESVRVVYDPRYINYSELCEVFWENHDPTQLNKQGNDVGTPYRSIIFYHTDEEMKIANSTLAKYQKALFDKEFGAINTKIVPRSIFYYAEDYHQQYLAKNEAGYNGVIPTGVVYPKKDYHWKNRTRIDIFYNKYHVANNRNEPDVIQNF